MVTRRDFLGAGLVSLSAGIIVPPVLAKSVLAAKADGTANDHILVVLQLGGGNDGLNTVIPYADAAYHSARPTIGIGADKVLPLDAQIGLHPNLTGIKKLYDAGHVAVVRGVGYDKPNYSHFEASHIWEYADPSLSSQEGWLGQLLSTQYAHLTTPLASCAVGQASTPTELRANGATVSVIDSVGSYAIQGGPGRQVAAPALYARTPGAYGVLFDQSSTIAQQGIAALAAGAATYKPAVSYEPQGVVYGSKVDLASSLQLAAQIIVTQPGVKVIHAVQGGFDTHEQEDRRHASLMSAVDAGVSAFFADLAAHGMDRKVTLFTWSEFGRRVKENGGVGTDHGAASTMFVVGGAVKGGLYGEQPSLSNTIDNGNLKATTDFRSVYQSLVRDWLGADANAVLNGTFPESGLTWS